MKQNDAIDKLIDTSFGSGLSSLVTPSEKKVPKAQVREQAPKKPKRTDDERRVVEERQNMNRKGPGNPLGKRVTISFKVKEEIALAFQDVHYSTGKTLSELYEEAMTCIIDRYKV